MSSGSVVTRVCHCVLYGSWTSVRIQDMNVMNKDEQKGHISIAWPYIHVTILPGQTANAPYVGTGLK